MADNSDDLNKELDQLLLGLFEKLETLQDARNALMNCMKNGFISMSKARYSMGNKSVGEIQYARVMTASTIVLISDSSSGDEEADDLRTFEVVFDVKGHGKDNGRVVKDFEQNESPGLRQRYSVKSNQKEMPEENKQGKKEALTASEKSRDKATDPLKWFGVLVPSSLRDCQRDFKTACRLSCEVKQLELEVDKIMADYQKLKEQKKLFSQILSKDK